MADLQLEQQTTIDTPPLRMPPSSVRMCPLPVGSQEEANTFLETISSGAALGSGARLERLGKQIPRIRQQYEEELVELVSEVTKRQQAGQAPKQIAEWAVNRRTQIAQELRKLSGLDERFVVELRDMKQYGKGGRTFASIEKRARMNPKLSGEAVYDKMIQGATKPNARISQAAKGANYLKHGGRLIVAFSLGTTAYRLATAEADELEQMLYQEAGGFAGGYLGAGIGTAGCLVFGITTAGWGLLACGAIGGLAGGILGTEGGDRLYFSANPKVELELLAGKRLDGRELLAAPPAEMCQP